MSAPRQGPSRMFVHPTWPDTLEELMRQADRASAKALEAALSVARPGLKWNQKN